MWLKLGCVFDNSDYRGCIVEENSFPETFQSSNKDIGKARTSPRHFPCENESRWRFWRSTWLVPFSFLITEYHPLPRAFHWFELSISWMLSDGKIQIKLRVVGRWKNISWNQFAVRCTQLFTLPLSCSLMEKSNKHNKHVSSEIRSCHVLWFAPRKYQQTWQPIWTKIPN